MFIQDCFLAIINSFNFQVVSRFDQCELIFVLYSLRKFVQIIIMEKNDKQINVNNTNKEIIAKL